MPSPRILVPLAPGFEEIEVIVPVNLWRRAGWDVLTAGLQPGPLEASRKTRHLADAEWSEVLSQNFDLIYLPGGRPGADHLRNSSPLLARLQAQAEAGRWIAAICAAPIVLEAAGLLHGKRWTAHPSAQAEIASGTSTHRPIEQDGHLITGRSAGVAAELALTVLRNLAGWSAVESVQQGYLAEPYLLDACHPDRFPAPPRTPEGHQTT
ncbi:MAG: DJ-1 family glyoxalase III [Verrucomicrobiia bacterium]